MGVYAFAQVPLIIIFIQKSNPISALTGITYQKLNYLHRASSRVALLFSWLHIIIWTIPVWNAGHFRRAYIIWVCRLRSAGHACTTTHYRASSPSSDSQVSGSQVSALCGGSLSSSSSSLTSSALCECRNPDPGSVGLTHSLFIGGAILHWQRLAHWLYPSLVLWIGDRLYRLYTQFRINPPKAFKWFGAKCAPEKAGECTITLMSPEIMTISARRPGLKWQPGQHL